jgi:DNA-binding transcriptional LysR family regulator
MRAVISRQPQTGCGAALLRARAATSGRIEEAAIGAAGSASKVRGRLRVIIDPFFSRIVLSRHLAAFLARYPDLCVELIMRDS